MRTSPLGMRRRVRRAPLLVCSILVLAGALGAACSDDGDEGTSPTTTSPAPSAAPEAEGDYAPTTEAPGEETTTSETGEPGGEEPGTVPGDGADVLTAEQVAAQLEALVAVYRQGLAEAAATRTLDERTLVAFSGAFTGQKADEELSALQQAGVERLNPTPPEVTIDAVEVAEADAGCAAGTVVIEGMQDFVVPPVEVRQPYAFRLVPAAEGAAAPAWRLAFLNFSTTGTPLDGVTCS